MVLITSSFLSFSLECFINFVACAGSHLAKPFVRDSAPARTRSGDCQRSCFLLYISVCFNDLLMDDCLSSARGLSLARSSVQPFPCLRFRSGLSPFWSSLSLFQSISSRVGSPPPAPLVPPPCRSASFESLHEDKCVEKKGARGGLTSLCYRREIYMGP